MSQPIRVMVIEREPLYRRGMVAALDSASDIEMIGSADTVESAYRFAHESEPHVALVGTSMTDPPGVELAAEIRRLNPAISVIIITAHESDDELFAAIRAGAFAYSGHDVSEESLFELIHRSARGEYVINEQLLAKPYVAARVLEQFRGNIDHGAALERELIPLTLRELEILRRVGDGMTNAEIADLLGISSQTVKNHVTAILRKMAVNDRTHAVVTAFRRGWLTIEDEPAPESTSQGVTDVPTSQLGSAEKL